MSICREVRSCSTYETHLLATLSAAERRALDSALRRVLAKLDSG
ncbi:MAG TPA: hypothetical protein VKD88_01320 [Gaiellaceae bacterium]|nr:hypothetical protein [Gaiellaceae bacterium]